MVEMPLEMIKGLAPEGQKLSNDSLLAHKAAAEAALDQAITDGMAAAGTAEVTKAISPFFMQALGGGEFPASLQKDISLTSPLNNSFYPAAGFVPFDLQAPSL